MTHRVDPFTVSLRTSSPSSQFFLVSPKEPACPALPPPFPYSPGKSKDMVEVKEKIARGNKNSLRVEGREFLNMDRVTGITYKLGKGVGKGQKQPSMLALCLCSLWKYSWICFSELTVLLEVIFAVKVVEHREGDSKNPLEVFN
ncbi:17633_t:CDS:2 [Funneliformis geosporum]|uniref:17633_t:CDS:1 n=1 Tax=Funneliformis geosporum TaxID=1117311 RepID=A0A9W4T3B7_9GLOM|nr:17633_t:CDS:2 [Funneliformis geosporum]